MSEEVLEIISSMMKSLALKYSFMELKGKPEYPYFTGEYLETPSQGEEGMQEGTFILTGHARNSWEALESAKRIIKNHITKAGKMVTTANGSVVAIFYENSTPVKSVDKELKKIQINLKIKEWSVT